MIFIWTCIPPQCTNKPNVNWSISRWDICKKKLKKCSFFALKDKNKTIRDSVLYMYFHNTPMYLRTKFYFIQPKYDIFRASCFWSLLREKYILNQRGKNIAIMDLTVYMDFHKMIMYKHIKTHVNLSFCLRGNLWYLNKHWQSLAKFGQMV